MLYESSTIERPAKSKNLPVVDHSMSPVQTPLKGQGVAILTVLCFEIRNPNGDTPRFNRSAYNRRSKRVLAQETSCWM